MFHGSTKPEIEFALLRSGRTIRPGKRRKIVGGRRTHSLFEESKYEVESRL